LAGDLIGGVELNYKLYFIISAMDLLGMVIGTQISKKLVDKIKTCWMVCINNEIHYRPQGTFLYRGVLWRNTTKYI
jgi:hypothetical protein